MSFSLWEGGGVIVARTQLSGYKFVHSLLRDLVSQEGLCCMELVIIYKIVSR
jgi:hypothetical protein